MSPWGGGGHHAAVGSPISPPPPRGALGVPQKHARGAAAPPASHHSTPPWSHSTHGWVVLVGAPMFYGAGSGGRVAVCTLRPKVRAPQPHPSSARGRQRGAPRASSPPGRTAAVPADTAGTARPPLGALWGQPGAPGGHRRGPVARSGRGGPAGGRGAGGRLHLPWEAGWHHLPVQPGETPAHPWSWGRGCPGSRLLLGDREVPGAGDTLAAGDVRAAPAPEGVPGAGNILGARDVSPALGAPVSPSASRVPGSPAGHAILARPSAVAGT